MTFAFELEMFHLFHKFLLLFSFCPFSVSFSLSLRPRSRSRSCLSLFTRRFKLSRRIKSTLRYSAGRFPLYSHGGLPKTRRHKAGSRYAKFKTSRLKDRKLEKFIGPGTRETTRVSPVKAKCSIAAPRKTRCYGWVKENCSDESSRLITP